MGKKCVDGASCGLTCISKEANCRDVLTAQATGIAGKVVGLLGSLLKENKHKIFEDGPVVAASLIVGHHAGPVAAAAASAGVAMAMQIGKKAYEHATSADVKSALKNGDSLAKVAKEAGARFLTDMTSEKFQKSLEKSVIKAVLYSAISEKIEHAVKVPLLGEAISDKAKESVHEVLQKGLGKFKDSIHSAVDNN